MKNFGLFVGSALLLGAVGACSSSKPTVTGAGAATGKEQPSDAGHGPDATSVNAPAEVTGCDRTKLYAVPEDLAALGPWPVGAKTVTLGAVPIKVEIWYPAKLGSDQGAEPAVYDYREWLPESEKAKVSDAVEGPPKGNGAYRDLPIDDAHGPYPTVIHIHGTASFRIASGVQAVHWASRGFIVVAADHPGMFMGDELAAVASTPCTKGTIPQDINRDVDAMIAALTDPSGDLSFLTGVIDMTELAIAGHSQGANAAAGMAAKANVKVIMPLAASSGVTASASLKSVLVLAGMSDTVIPFTSDQAAYTASPPLKRLVGITNTGHLVPTTLCGLRNPAGKDLVAVGNEAGVCGMNLANFLWDCNPSYIPQEKGDDIVDYVTTGVLEETLHCTDRTAQFAAFQSTYPDVGEFKEQKQ